MLLAVGEEACDIYHLHLRAELKNWVVFLKSTSRCWMMPLVLLVWLFLDTKVSIQTPGLFCNHMRL